MRRDAAKSADRSGRRCEHPSLLRLWLVVSALWTIATGIRVIRVWLPIEGWQGVFAGPWLWLELLLPPLMFGSIILAVRQVADNRRICHIWWRRHRQS